MGKYWDPGRILPYQRTFNFINGPRSIGKTYSLLKWLIKQALKGKEFVYVVRTQDEKKDMVLEFALKKVLQNEYPSLECGFSSSACMFESRTLAHCLALTEAIKVKKRSFPNVHYMVFDEYTIEKGTGRYINGFQEPELFINLYDTIDRRENRVKCFFMGNNTSYYNPYHLYPLFGMPHDVDFVDEGNIWTNATTLFERALPSEELMEEFEDNAFVKAVSTTRYGEYAVGGVYADDKFRPVQPLGPKSIYRATVHTPGGVFGMYTDPIEQKLIFSSKVDSKYPIKFSLSRDGIKDGFPFITPNYDAYKALLKRAAGDCSIVFDSMAVKSQIEQDLYKII